MSPTIEALMGSIDEPAIDHADEGMTVAARMAMVAARCRKTARILRPEDVTARRPAYGGTYSLGFHTAPAAEVEAFFADTDCVTESLRNVVDELLILHVIDDRGAPVEAAELMCNGERLPTVGIGEGFFVREMPSPFYGPYTVEADGRTASLDAVPPAGVVRVRV